MGSKFFSTVYFSVFTLVFFVLWVEFLPASFSHYGGEDAVIENLSALFFLISSIGFFIVAKKSSFLKNQGSGYAYFMIISWAVLMFIFAGEEISWGQRIFDFSTPETIIEINKQDEFNIHNIGFVDSFAGGKYRYLSLMMLLTGVVFPLMAMFSRGKKLFQKFSYPVCPLQYGLFFLGSYIFGKFYVAWYPAVELGDLNSITEVREFIFGLGMVCFALYGVYKPNSLFLAKD